MGVILHFYVVPEAVAEDPEEFDWDVAWGTRLCMEGKHSDLYSRIFNHDHFKTTRFLIDRGIPTGQIPAGDLARVMARFHEEHPGRLWAEEVAAIAYLATLLPDRPIVVENS